MSKARNNLKEYATKKSIIPFVVSCVLSTGMLHFTISVNIFGNNIVSNIVSPIIWLSLFVFLYLVLSAYATYVFYPKKPGEEFYTESNKEKCLHFAMEIFMGFFLGFTFITILLLLFFGINVAIYYLFMY